MPRITERMTISIPPDLAATLRAYAGEHHRGKISTAINAILAERFRVTKSPASGAPEGNDS